MSILVPAFRDDLRLVIYKVFLWFKFSVKHSPHFLVLLLYPPALLSISHLISHAAPISFRFQMYLESDVSFGVFLWLNVRLCTVNLFLNGGSVSPMYVFLVSFLPLTVYIIIFDVNGL